jgi:hypothetical protein
VLHPSILAHWRGPRKGIGEIGAKIARRQRVGSVPWERLAAGMAEAACASRGVAEIIDLDNRGADYRRDN